MRLCTGKPKLAVATPELAEQWHPHMNKPLTPGDVSAGSSRRVWWQCRACPCGTKHDWQARPSCS